MRPPSAPAPQHRWQQRPLEPAAVRAHARHRQRPQGPAPHLRECAGSGRWGRPACCPPVQGPAAHALPLLLPPPCHAHSGAKHRGHVGGPGGAAVRAGALAPRRRRGRHRNRAQQASAAGQGRHRQPRCQRCAPWPRPRRPQGPARRQLHRCGRRAAARAVQRRCERWRAGPLTADPAAHARPRAPGHYCPAEPGGGAEGAGQRRERGGRARHPGCGERGSPAPAGGWGWLGALPAAAFEAPLALHTPQNPPPCPQYLYGDMPRMDSGTCEPGWPPDLQSARRPPTRAAQLLPGTVRSLIHLSTHGCSHSCLLQGRTRAPTTSVSPPVSRRSARTTSSLSARCRTTSALRGT